MHTEDTIALQLLGKAKALYLASSMGVTHLLEPQVPGTLGLLGYFSLHTSALRVFEEQANGLRTETQIVGFVRKQDSKEIRPVKHEENQP